MRILTKSVIIIIFAFMSIISIRMAVERERANCLVADHLIKELGGLRQGQTGRVEFLLTNDSSKSITIERVLPTSIVLSRN